MNRRHIHTLTRRSFRWLQSLPLDATTAPSLLHTVPLETSQLPSVLSLCKWHAFSSQYGRPNVIYPWTEKPGTIFRLLRKSNKRENHTKANESQIIAQSLPPQVWVSVCTVCYGLKICVQSTFAEAICVCHVCPRCTRPHSTSNSQCVLMLLVAGEENVGTEVFTGELLPRWRQVFLLVHPLHLNVQYHMEELGILLGRVTSIQLWSERRNSMNGKENVCWVIVWVRKQTAISRVCFSAVRQIKFIYIAYFSNKAIQNVLHKASKASRQSAKEIYYKRTFNTNRNAIKELENRK